MLYFIYYIANKLCEWNKDWWIGNLNIYFEYVKVLYNIIYVYLWSLMNNDLMFEKKS